MKIFKKALFAILAFTYTATSLSAQKSLLYKIESENIKTSYVFGTMHMMPKEDFLLEEKVKKAFSESDFIMMELDMDQGNMQAEIMKYAILADKDSLQHHMSQEEYIILDNYFTTKMGVGVAAFSKMKPFVVSATAMTAHLGKNMASFETGFLQMAATQGKEIKGLETVAFQMSIFDERPYDQQIDEIIEMLEKKGGIGAYFDEIVDTYNSHDIEVLYEKLNSLFEGDDAFKEKLLADRNKNWIPKIGINSKENRVFYAVGAGHLGGKKGVVALLKKAGYTVTPVQ